MASTHIVIVDGPMEAGISACVITDLNRCEIAISSNVGGIAQCSFVRLSRRDLSLLIHGLVSIKQGLKWEPR